MSEYTLTYVKGGRAAHFRGSFAECEHELGRLDAFYPPVSRAHIEEVRENVREIVRVYETARRKNGTRYLKTTKRVRVKPVKTVKEVKPVEEPVVVSNNVVVEAPENLILNSRPRLDPKVEAMVAREELVEARNMALSLAGARARERQQTVAAAERTLEDFRRAARGKTPEQLRRENYRALARMEQNKSYERAHSAPTRRRVSGRSMHLRGTYVEDINQSTLYQNLRFDDPNGPRAVGSDFLTHGPGDVPSSTKPSFTHDPEWVRRKELGAFGAVGRSGRVPVPGEGWQSWNKVTQ